MRQDGAQVTRSARGIRVVDREVGRGAGVEIIKGEPGFGDNPRCPHEVVELGIIELGIVELGIVEEADVAVITSSAHEVHARDEPMRARQSELFREQRVCVQQAEEVTGQEGMLPRQRGPRAEAVGTWLSRVHASQPALFKAVMTGMVFKTARMNPDCPDGAIVMPSLRA